MFCLQTTKRINLKPLFFIIYDDVRITTHDHEPSRPFTKLNIYLGIQKSIIYIIIIIIACFALLTHHSPLELKKRASLFALYIHTHTWFFFHHMSRQAHKTLFLLLLLQLPRFSFFIINNIHTLPASFKK